MSRFLISTTIVFVFLVTSVFAGAPPAGAIPNWHYQFQYGTNESALIGGVTGGSGSSIYLPSSGSGHIAVENSGNLWTSWINSGHSFTNELRLWTNPGTTTPFLLKWQSYSWSDLWVGFRPDERPQVNVTVTLDGIALPVQHTVAGEVWLPAGEHQLVFSAQPVPEPGNLLVLGAGLVGFAGFIRRR